MVAMTAGLRGPSTESAKAFWTDGTDKRAAGASTSAMSAIVLRFCLIFRIFFFSNAENCQYDS